jgi:hypothetical protein
MPCLKTSFDSEAPIAEESSRSQHERHVVGRQHSPRSARKRVCQRQVRCCGSFLLRSLGLNTSFGEDPPSRPGTLSTFDRVSFSPI